MICAFRNSEYFFFLLLISEVTVYTIITQIRDLHVEIKSQLDATDVFIADLIACSTCFRHHYAHHQELESIIQLVAACGIWCFGFQVVGMVWN